MIGNQLTVAKNIVGNSFSAIYRERTNLAQALVIPVALNLAISAALMLKPTVTVLVLVFVPLIMVYTMFAIAIHRVILLGPESTPRWGIYVWTERETRFAVRLAALIMMVIIAFSSTFVLPLFGALIGLFVLIFIAPRLALVLPAIAIGKVIEFDEAWNISKNHKFTFFLIGILIPVLSGLPNSILKEMPYGFSIASVYGIFASVFLVVCYSLAFRHIVTAQHWQLKA